MRTVVALLVVLLAARARADEGQTIGLYAPSAPFDGPVARLELISRLAAHLGPGWSGRAFAKAADFSAAVKRGELAFAVLDAPYLAALGVPYAVIAEGTRGGSTSTPWQLVAAAPATRVLDLKGKVVAVPSIGAPGAREEAFVHEVLLEGELPRGSFTRIVSAPDALSALASVEHGRADAALVPAGLDLPPGVRRLATLGNVGWPVLVALPGARPAAVEAVAAAVAGFRGDAVLERFVRGDASATRALAARFAARERRGPFASPPIRLAVDALLAGRRFEIPLVDVAVYAVEP